jgi:signal transduction histidine kinase
LSRTGAGERAWVKSPPIGRLAIQFGTVFALAMLAMGLIVFVVAEERIAQRIDNALDYHSAKFLGRGETPDPARVTARIVEWQHRKVLSERTYILYDRNGQRIAGRLDLPPPPTGFSNVRFKGGGKTWQKGRALAVRLPGGELFVVVQHSEAAASLKALLPYVVAAIFISALLTGLAAAFLFARQTARRLAETQAAADAIANGDLSRRIATDRLDGMFAVQAESLNRMLDRMEDMVRTQRHFASALAHDLRTPLTRLRGMLTADLAQDGPGREKLIERAERECASIIAIFDALLRLAEIESGFHPSAMRDLSLHDLIEDVAETMEPVIADAGSELVAEPLDDVAIRGDANLINQLLVNLLENVATHTPAGTRAVLSLRHRDGRAQITIGDNGPGLPPDERARVAMPFERGRGAAGRRGSGLGLAIAQAIVRFHDGDLELADNAPGLQVRISFPASAAAFSAALPAGA